VQPGANVVGSIATESGAVYVGGEQHYGDEVGRKVDTGGGAYYEHFTVIHLPPGEQYTPPPLPPADALPDPGDLPPGSLLPFPRNAVFTGRVPDLLGVAQALFHDRAGPLALSGLGGVGKSQLAIELGYRYGRFTHGVHWINAAGTPEQSNIDAEIDARIAACGLALSLPAWPAEQAEQAAATLAAWRAQPFRLVVLDNLEDPSLLAAALSRLGGLRVLITCRRASWPPSLGVSSRPLGVLDRPESRSLLRALAEPLAGEPDAALDAIAERFGDLPLGLHVAGSYIQESGLSAGQYLAALQKRGGALRHQQLPGWARSSPTGHELDLAATFSLSWERLDPADESERLARLAFCMAGYCAPNVPIPAGIFSRALGEEDEAALGLALRRLEALGLAERAQAGPRLHPLLAEFARLKDGEQAESALPALAQALAGLAFQANQTGLPQRFIPLRPHVSAVAEAAEVAALQGAGVLWNELGYHQRDAANYHQARASHERALRIDEAALGPGHPDVARDVNNLGLVLQYLGDLPGARAHFERALRILEASLPPGHPTVATLVNNLGLVLQALGDLPGARAHFERALRISEAALGPDHPDVAIDANNLGSVLQDLGDLPGARAHFERALRIDKAALGPDHPAVARDANNLGLVLQALGDLPGARAHFERSLHIDEAALGPDHPTVAIRVNNLGSVLLAQGDLPGARAHFERSLHIDEAALGPDHPDVARDVNNLGSVLQDLGDLPGARAHFERALRIGEAALGPDHPTVAIRVNNLGSVLLAQGDLPGARAHFERALRIWEAALPPGHPHLRIVRENLASLG
jgi:tetratricopeptide (TPR) repeat protein